MININVHNIEHITLEKARLTGIDTVVVRLIITDNSGRETSITLFSDVLSKLDFDDITGR